MKPSDSGLNWATFAFLLVVAAATAGAVLWFGLLKK
jgi:hypothetical protein